MPLTAKGEEIKSSMEHEYGSKKGEEVFYASRNAGTISGVDASSGVLAGASPVTGPPEDPTLMPPAPTLLTQLAPAEPTDCSVERMMAGGHDYNNDGASPIGGLPQQMSFNDMRAWKP